MQITLEPITEERFAPFGELIAVGAAFGRTDFVARIENARPHARANLATIKLEPTPLPATITRMEKHAYSSQAFIPLDVARYVVIVAPDRAGAPDEAELIGFVVPSGVGVSYRAGTWHTGLMIIDRPGAFAMLVHEDGTVDDCTIVPVQSFSVVV